MGKMRFVLILCLFINIVFSISVEYQLKPGWQLIGLPSTGWPVEIADFLPIVPPVYSYNTETGSYEEHTEFPDHLGLGFWAFSEFDTTVVVEYPVEVGVDSFNLAVSEGWNLLAVPGAVLMNEITYHLPPSISTNTYDPALGSFDNIRNFPMLNEGFWLYSTVDTTVQLSYHTHDLVDVDTGRALAEDIGITLLADDYGYHRFLRLSLDKEGYLFVPPGFYNAYCSTAGFYRNSYPVWSNHLILVDLDAIPNTPFTVTGVIWINGTWGGEHHLRENDISLSFADSIQYSTTDSLGRFLFEPMPEGVCTLVVYYRQFIGDRDTIFEIKFGVENTEETNCYNLSFDRPVPIGAPNLYIYPETTSVVDISVEIENGFIVESEPPYEVGWSVTIDPEGWIEGGEYGFLYYDYIASESWQTDSAWIIEGDALVEAVTEMLESYGVTGREIPDFFDYWLPRFPEANYFSFYPQPDSLKSELNISPTPDSQLQLLFLIHPSATRPPIPQPHTPTAFIRTGFSVVEWGGI